MDRISDAGRQRVAELRAGGAPAWRLHRGISRSRYAIRRAVAALRRAPGREPRRSPGRLWLAGREQISGGPAAGEPAGECRPAGRAPAGGVPEVAANGGGDRYRACAAERRAVRLMRGPGPARLARCPRLREAVESNLELRWSPRQMAGHARFSAAAGVPACFGDPRRPGQRGTENTGALRRKYFPRSTDFRALPQSDPDAVAAELNDRPRQTPGWKSPCQALDEALR